MLLHLQSGLLRRLGPCCTPANKGDPLACEAQLDAEGFHFHLSDCELGCSLDQVWHVPGVACLTAARWDIF